MEWIAANEPVSVFDFNGNGRIDFGDVVRLFTTLGDPVVTPITAAFTADRTTGPAPLAVRFASTSTGPFDDLAWTVSSGQDPVATMNGTAPTYTFEAAGNYTVALTARNTSTNRSDTATQPVTVTGPAGANRPYPAAHPVPGRVEAEDYDVSVGSPAYADTTAINEGGAYRFDAVDIEVLSRNYSIGWIRSGEFLTYSVDTTAAGDFALTLSVANAEAITKPVRVYLDGVPAGEVRIGSTGNWVVFREFAASAPLTIPEGRHVVTIAFEGVHRLNFDWLSLAAIAPTPTPTPTVTAVPEAPYPTAHVLPAKIEAEHFDAGGEGVAYHDFEPANLGTNRALRPGEGVDIETAGGVTDVCFVRAGEFLNYSVDATAADNVTLSLRAANPEATTKAVTVYLDGVPAGQVLIAPTGGWTAYREFSASAPLTISVGSPRRDHRVRGGPAAEPRLAEPRDGRPDPDSDADGNSDGDADRHGDGDADPLTVEPCGTTTGRMKNQVDPARRRRDTDGAPMPSDDLPTIAGPIPGPPSSSPVQTLPHSSGRRHSAYPY